MQYEPTNARESLEVHYAERLSAVDRQREREEPQLRLVVKATDEQIAARIAELDVQRQGIRSQFAREVAKIDAEWTRV